MTVRLQEAGQETSSVPGMADGHLEVQVRQFMTPGVLAISEDASLAQVYRAMSKHEIHAVLVVGRIEGRPLGWVTARGLLGWMQEDAAIVSARDAITERPTAIEPSASVREALTAISQLGVSRLLVCPREGAFPEGVVTDQDLITLQGR